MLSLHSVWLWPSCTEVKVLLTASGSTWASCDKAKMVQWHESAEEMLLQISQDPHRALCQTCICGYSHNTLTKPYIYFGRINQWWPSIIRHYFYSSFPSILTQLLHFFSDLFLFLCSSSLCFIMLMTSDRGNNMIGNSYYQNRMPIYWDASNQNSPSLCLELEPALHSPGPSWRVQHHKP